MNFPDVPPTLEVLRKIKQEIEKLSKEQIDAMKAATYVGMTPDEAKAYDLRRQRITALTHELRLLEQAP